MRPPVKEMLTVKSQKNAARNEVHTLLLPGKMRGPGSGNRSAEDSERTGPGGGFSFIQAACRGHHLKSCLGAEKRTDCLLQVGG